MKLAFIGLGRMGNRMVIKLLESGHEVVVWNRSKDKVDELLSQKGKNWKISSADTVEALVAALGETKVVWSMLPAGDATEQMLMGPGGIAEFVGEGDIVVDGSNSNFADTQRRYEYFRDKGIKFLGIGVSGGVIAAKTGYPLMAGGDMDAYMSIKPILESLAKPSGGYEYFGEGGAGHFVKMVHNAIEYGYMQAIGEGFGVMEKAPYELDLLKVAKLYTKGTLVSGFMMERAVESLEEDPKLAKISGYIEDSGEGRWAVEQAKEESVPIGIIEESLNFRVKSREDASVASTYAARMVAALRYAFGRHEVKKK